jgi:UDP-N-acetylglucosamine pyrophosphorylase
LVSFNAQRFRRLKEEEQEFFNDANFDHAVEISRQRAATEEAGHLLMAAEQQKLLEVNTQRQAEAAAREQAKLTQNKAPHKWLASLRG